MNVMLIPIKGLILRFYGDEFDLDAEKNLADMGGEGNLINIPLERDGAHIGTVKLLLAPTEQEMNLRAMRMVAKLTEIHFIFRGPVMFEGLDKAETEALVEEYG